MSKCKKKIFSISLSLQVLNEICCFGFYLYLYFKIEDVILGRFKGLDSYVCLLVQLFRDGY